MKELYTEIRIDAPPELIWKILTDFTSYPKWNPFVRSISGELKPGAKLMVHLQPPDSAGRDFKPTLLEVIPNKELRWLGSMILPGLLDGEHIFTIKPQGTRRVLFIQREVFSGLLVPLIVPLIEDNTLCGFVEMNYALKARAERVFQELRYA